MLADATPIADVRGPIDTLVIVGGPGAESGSYDPNFIAWIAKAARQSRRVASICTGAFLLAEAPQYMHPVVALVTAGVEMDVLGIDYASFTESDRNAVVQAFPRPAHFKEDILQAFYDGIKHKFETTFGNVKADVLAAKDPDFHHGNFCSVIRNSPWFG
ncbi:putative intracellular protease/amidase [Edaphobacter lichenicola]|uniref:Intracellular protease/amidase n=1 Tax=Tunturiibacter lichenicola TaxID=2051959 RepID=A0A7W8JA90_9BACT|nr:putative intracellular protease/amidase [Edaphobacter lichenicola]